MERWEKERVGKTFSPELRALEGSRRSAVHAGIDLLCSTDAWDHLRRNGQSARAARQVMRAGIACLLETA